MARLNLSFVCIVLLLAGCGSDVNFRVVDLHTGGIVPGATADQFRQDLTLGRLADGALTAPQFVATSRADANGEVKFQGVKPGDEFYFRTTDLNPPDKRASACRYADGYVYIYWLEGASPSQSREMHLRLERITNCYVVPLIPETDFAATQPTTRPSLRDELRPYEDPEHKSSDDD